MVPLHYFESFCHEVLPHLRLQSDTPTVLSKMAPLHAWNDFRSHYLNVLNQLFSILSTPLSRQDQL